MLNYWLAGFWRVPVNPQLQDSFCVFSSMWQLIPACASATPGLEGITPD